MSELEEAELTDEELMSDADARVEDSPAPEYEAPETPAHDNEPVPAAGEDRELAGAPETREPDPETQALVERGGGRAGDWERVNGCEGIWKFDRENEKIYNPATGESYTDITDPGAALTMRDAARHWNEGGGRNYVESVWIDRTDATVNVLQLILDERGNVGWRWDRRELLFSKEEPAGESIEEPAGVRAALWPEIFGHIFEPAANDDSPAAPMIPERTEGFALEDAEPAEISDEPISNENESENENKAVSASAAPALDGSAPETPATAQSVERAAGSAAPDACLVELLKGDPLAPADPSGAAAREPDAVRESARNGAGEAASRGAARPEAVAESETGIRSGAISGCDSAHPARGIGESGGESGRDAKAGIIRGQKAPNRLLAREAQDAAAGFPNPADIAFRGPAEKSERSPEAARGGSRAEAPEREEKKDGIAEARAAERGARARSRPEAQAQSRAEEKGAEATSGRSDSPAAVESGETARSDPQERVPEADAAAPETAMSADGRTQHPIVVERAESRNQSVAPREADGPAMQAIGVPARAEREREAAGDAQTDERPDGTKSAAAHEDRGERLDRPRSAEAVMRSIGTPVHAPRARGTEFAGARAIPGMRRISGAPRRRSPAGTRRAGIPPRRVSLNGISMELAA